MKTLKACSGFCHVRGAHSERHSLSRLYPPRCGYSFHSHQPSLSSTLNSTHSTLVLKRWFLGIREHRLYEDSMLQFHRVGTNRWKQTQSSAFFYKKNHSFSKEELLKHARDLAAIIRDREGELSMEREERIYARRTLNVNYCFDVLEACMEVAKETQDIGVAHQASFLLEAMECVLHASSPHDGQQRERNLSLAPTTPFYDVVLQSYVVCNGGKDAAQKAQTVLERMMDRCRNWMEGRYVAPPPSAPTVKTFNIVVNAWAKSRQRDAGYRAQHVVDLMNNWDIHCKEAAKRTKEHYPGVSANERTLVSVVDAWSKSRHPNAAQHATSILFGAIEESKQNPSFTLDPALFHVVLGTWVRCSGGSKAGERAEEILSVMEQCTHFGGSALRPGTRAYAVVMEVWMRCEQVEKKGHAAQRAESLLRTMKDIYERKREPYIKPNNECFTNCIAAWSLARHRKDAPERAEALLVMLTDLYDRTKDGAFRPDVRLYNSVIAAWTRASDHSDSMERARGWLRSLRRHTQPDLVTFNTILDGMGKRGMGGEALELLEWLETVGRDSPDLLPDRQVPWSTELYLTGALITHVALLNQQNHVQQYVISHRTG